MSDDKPTVPERVARFGGQLGLGVVFVGLVLVFLGWNGAAGEDYLPAQMPYVISGGLAGVSIVILGSSLLLVENQRKDRAALEASLAQLQATLEKMQGSSGSPGAPSPAATTFSGSDELVVAGEHDYVKAGSKLAEGRVDARVMTRAEAEAAGLKPSRVDFDAADDTVSSTLPPSRPPRRAAPRKAAKKSAKRTQASAKKKR